ncbi:MAG: FtsW/RodA/SpoVE family cell cycle protein [Bacteroidales bacterium]|nr:FtsW/RodA/SpoVE family cell cycle protein [Bacteroidales bacterium]
MVEHLKKYIRGDKYMWTFIMMLVIASIIAVFSTATVLAYSQHGGDIVGTVLRHVCLLAFGVGVMIVMSNIPPKYISGWAPLALLAGIGMLVMVLAFGTSRNGSSRWLSLGIVQFQPSEFAKMALIVFVARQLALNLMNPNNALKSAGIAIVLVAGLVVLENLSTCLLIVMSCCVLLLIGRVSFYWIATAGVVVACFFALLIFLAPYPPVKNIFPRATTWRARVERFADVDDSEKTGKGDNYQAEQSKIAIAVGGINGKGPGNSQMKNYLPMAFSDFIFAIILEEFGIWGMFWIIIAYAGLMGRAVVLSRHCVKPFHTYAMLGLSFLLTIQAIINMFVAVGLMPVTGQTLPLVSMGGTSNVLTGLAFGIILSISADVNENLEKTTSSAVAQDNVQTRKSKESASEEFDEADAVTYSEDN